MNRPTFIKTGLSALAGLLGLPVASHGKTRRTPARVIEYWDYDWDPDWGIGFSAESLEELLMTTCENFFRGYDCYLDTVIEIVGVGRSDMVTADGEPLFEPILTGSVDLYDWAERNLPPEKFEKIEWCS